MSKHTPGPWKVFDRSEMYIKTEVPGSGGDVAIVQRNGMDTTWANAHLIAAAPDLLEAVKWCVSMFGNEPAHGPGQRMTMAEYKALNAIIAKAEGRS